MQITLNRSYLLLLATLLLTSPLILAPAAHAHEGHAGDKKTFLATKLALKELMPSGSKIVRRKQRPNDMQIDWAKKELGVGLDDKVVTYYLARDRASEKELAAATVGEFAYHHGKVGLALGVDLDGKITRAAVLSLHGKYVPELARSLKGGWLPSLKGLTVKGLAARAEKAGSDDRAAQIILKALAGMGASLVALAQQG